MCAVRSLRDRRINRVINSRNAIGKFAGLERGRVGNRCGSDGKIYPSSQRNIDVMNR